MSEAVEVTGSFGVISDEPVTGKTLNVQVPRIALQSNQIPGASIHGTPGDDPFDVLTRHCRNVVEVRVVVKNGQPLLLGRSGDQEIGNLSAAKALLREQPLHLSRSREMLSGDWNEIHDLQGHRQGVPLIHVSSGEADLEVRHHRPTHLTHLDKWPENFTNCR